MHIISFNNGVVSLTVKNNCPQPVTGNSPVNYSILKYALITRIHGITGHIEPLTKGRVYKQKRGEIAPK